LKKISIIGGLILTVIIAAAVNFYPQKSDQFPGERFHGKMVEKLKLTDEQKDKIEQLGIDHQKAMIDLRADMQKKRLALKELLAKGNYSRADYLNQMNDISSARNKIAAARANHRMDVYELLDDQQKKIFNEMPMMGGPRGERGGMMDGQCPMGRHQGGKNYHNQ
jgi:Spy/CpxP family protein refolding chaperone